MDYGYSSPGKYLICTVRENGETHAYEIPEMWLVGATTDGVTYADAIQVWHQQALLQKLYEKQAVERSFHPDDVIRDGDF